MAKRPTIAAFLGGAGEPTLGQIFGNSVKMCVKDQPASIMRPGSCITWSHSRTSSLKMTSSNIPTLDERSKQTIIRTTVDGYYLLIFHANVNVTNQDSGRVMFDLLINNEAVARMGIVTPYVNSYTIHWTDAVLLPPNATIAMRLTDDSNSIQIPDSTTNDDAAPAFEVIGLTIVH